MCCMKLRTKTVAMLLVIALLFFGTLYAISYNIISSSYGKLETNEVSETVGQVRGAMLNEYSVLNSKLTDWSAWDDTYAFVQDNNSAYITSNLDPTSLKDFGINFLIFVNSTGNVVYGLGVNLSNATKMPVPQSLLNLVASDPAVWDFRSTTANFTGLTLLPEGPLILASQPILTSQGQGPIHGALIFGRYLDSAFVQQLSTTLSLPLNMTLYGTWQASGAVSSYVSIPPSTYIHPVNADSIAGYYVMDDINARPAVVLGTVLPREFYQQGLTTMNYIELSVGAAVAIFGIGMLLLIQGMVLSPLRRLASEVLTISNRKTLSARVSVSGDDEIAMLSQKINDMLEEQEKMTVQLQRSERFSAIGELATMVAHDLRNPLQGIANATFYLKANASGGARRTEMLDLIEQDVKYSDKIVNDLLDYSKDLRLELSETSPRLLIDRTLSVVGVPKNVSVRDETGDRPTLRVDVDKIVRTFANIVSNAVDAMPDGGSLAIDTKESDHAVDFVFADSGIGMTKEVMEKIYAPLYTTKAKGMGFGLSISKRIIEAHGGQISVESAPGRGTTFTISLPFDSTGGESS